MNTQKIIQLLGYTAKEAKIYLTTLQLGEAHISDIAAAVKLPRTSVQSIADRLHKKGLMNFYVMKRYKYWSAENPERLLSVIKNREEMIYEAMPVLTALRKASWNKRKTKVPRIPDWEPFRALADNSLQAILITNESAEIMYVNDAWEKMFGYSLDEIYGENPRILQSGRTHTNIYKKLWKTLLSEKIFHTEEIIDKRKDGSILNLLTTIFTVRHNNKIFYIQILDDVTEQKRIENMKNKLTKSGD